MKKYKVLTPIIYGGTVKNIGTVLENLTSEEEKRMLQRNLIEEYKEEPKAEVADTDGDNADSGNSDADTGTENGAADTDDDSGNEDIEEQIIEPYTAAELKSFDKPKLLEIVKELGLSVQSNIGVEKLITKILDEYKAIEKENKDENKDGNPE